MENNNFLVRIQCMTYNHAPYIEDAMNGFTMQQTNFPYICVIIDDASTDGEQEVIKNYLKEHFDLEDKYVARHKETDDYHLTFARHKTNRNCYFAVLYLKYNHNSIRKPKSPYVQEWTDTKYVALCEGDDYWIDSYKLQKQVDFLENNPDYAMSYTRSKHLEQKTGKLSLGPYSPFNGFENVLLKNPVETLTVVIRKESLSEYYKDINPSHYGWLMGDYPIWLYMSANYKIHYFSDVTSVYRMNQGSASRPTEFEKKMKFLQSHVDVQLFFAKKYNVSKDVVRAIDYKANYNMALACVGYKQYKKAIPFISNLKCKDACKCVAHVIMNIVR